MPPSACSRFTSFTARVEALPAVAPRFARDRPFRAAVRSSRRSPVRASGFDASGYPRGVALRSVLTPHAYSAGRSLRADGARGWLTVLLEARSLAPTGRSRRRERARVVGELVVVESYGWRVVVSEEDAE